MRDGSTATSHKSCDFCMTPLPLSRDLVTQPRWLLLTFWSLDIAYEGTPGCLNAAESCPTSLLRCLTGRLNSFLDNRQTEADTLSQESTNSLRQALLGICSLWSDLWVTNSHPVCSWDSMEAKHERKSPGSRKSLHEGTQLPTKLEDNFQAFGPSSLTRQRVSYSFKIHTLISAFVLSLE